MDDCNLGRRKLIQLALQGVALSATPLAGPHRHALAQTGSTQAATNFSAATVVERARLLAAKPYDPPRSTPLENIGDASPQDAAAIRYRAANWIWADEKLRYVIEPLHRSRNMPNEVDIYTAEGSAITQLTYDAQKFDFGKLEPPPASVQLGFSGFVIHARNLAGRLRPIASIRNAAVLSAIAPDQEWGAVSRPIAVNSADQKSESPRIRAIWIEKPRPSASALLLHALVDTSSLTGAFQFTLRAEDAVLIDTECTIFARRDIEHVGLSPIHASHLVGPLSPRGQNDVRPAVYEAAGVQMLSGRGEWIWRPVANRNRLQVSAFVDSNPRGFGLVQRDRSFDTFLDDENAWHRRPSVWVEPIGDWGPGEVTLMEIPAEASNNKNVACYWRPKSGLARGSETQFAYRQFWSWHLPDRPQTTIVTRSRIGRGSAGSSEPKYRFLVEFSGALLEDQAKARSITPYLWASAGHVDRIRTFRTPQNGKMRIVFDLVPGNASLVELRLLLERDNRAMSETWLYRWTA